MYRQGQWYRFITDWPGSVRRVVAADTGNTVQRLDYSPFGRVLEDTYPGLQPFGFAEGLYDHKTGLVRFGARDYDPLVGRWTNKDPIGFAGGDTKSVRVCDAGPGEFCGSGRTGAKPSEPRRPSLVSQTGTCTDLPSQ